MLACLGRLGLWLGVVGLLLGLPLAAAATPLGLQNGDIVSEIEWDARQDVAGDGGSYTATGGDGVSAGDLDVDGRLTSVTVQGPTTTVVSDTNFVLNAVLSSFTITPLGGTLQLIQAVFVGVAGDDIVVTDGTGTILTAELSATGLFIGGVIDTNNLSVIDVQNIAATDITITGGDAALVAALGVVGTLELTGDIEDFTPTLGTILADGDLDESFVFTGGGVITPTNPSAFVPEPATAGLLLVGLALCLGSRRRALRVH